MKLTLLDAETLGTDICLKPLEQAGDLTVYPKTAQKEIAQRIENAEAVITNKRKLNRENLQNAKNLKLICVTATGYDNIDLDYCRKRGIALCNVPGYSTDSVCQVTLAMVLSLSTRLEEYRNYVRSGAYSAGKTANFLGYPWMELAGKTWGVVGGGAIGQKVAEVASAMGCRVLMCRRKDDPRFETADIGRICAEADILTVHVPLSDSTRTLISRERIEKMKPTAIVVNTARGAVADEQALAEAVETGKIGALGVDVYGTEPFPAGHPYTKIAGMPNVCLTPHMAWSALEARNRCVREVAENIRAFARGEVRNRIL